MALGISKNLVGKITKSGLRGSAMANALSDALTNQKTANSIETAGEKQPLTKSVGR